VTALRTRLRRAARIGVIEVALLTVGACTAAPPDEPPRATYRCGDVTFTATFVNDSVFVAFRGDTIRLPIAISASGARYSDGQRTFWEHQGTARLELPDTTIDACPIVED